MAFCIFAFVVLEKNYMFLKILFLNPLTMEHHHKTTCDKCQYHLRVNAVAKRNPQYFFRYNQMTTDTNTMLSSFFLDIGILHLIASFVRNYVYCVFFSNKEVFGYSSFNSCQPCWSNWLLACRGLNDAKWCMNNAMKFPFEEFGTMDLNSELSEILNGI
jgi:hypothetical protein